ncbi:MAG: hypothetical protein AAGF84_04455 [Planctomycetota bacterium]
MPLRRPNSPPEPRPYPRSVGQVNAFVIALPWLIGGSLWVTVGIDCLTGESWQGALDAVMVSHLAASVAGLAPWFIVLFTTAPWPIAYARVPRDEFRRRVTVAGLGLGVLAVSVVATYLADFWPAWLPDTNAWGI